MRIVVIGAGIAGLTAAHDLTQAGHEVVVLESSDRVGGKLYRRKVAGVTVDVGGEAMLARIPEGVALAESLGLEIVHPTSAKSQIWTRDKLRPLPRALMGAPFDLDELAASGVLTADGLERARAEVDIPLREYGEDASVGDVIADRYGDEVTDRLVEPLLGGVYAGRARAISTKLAVPQLWSLIQKGPLTPQLAALMPRPTLSTEPPAPVFGGIAGGMASLPEALARDLAVHLGVTATKLQRKGNGFVVSTSRGDIDADAVVVATPAKPTAQLLSDLAPEASRELAAIESASMAVITFAFKISDIEGIDELDGTRSGFLVPPVDGREIKASTFSFAKWQWTRDAGAAEGLVHLRTSIGRVHEVSVELGHEELIARSLRDLHAAIGLTAHPVDTHVQRWVDGLPQYGVGHAERVARIQASVATVPGLVLTGAAYQGVGIPAVIRNAQAAAVSLN